MKFGGTSLTTKNKKLVTLKRSDGTNEQNINLVIAPLPSDFMDQLRAKGAIKTVEPPSKWAEEKPGLVKRAPDGKPIKEYDRNDKDYLRTQAQMVRRMQALAFRESLKHDPTVEWVIAEPAKDASAEAWEQYADSVVEEVFDPVTGMEPREVDFVIDEAGKLALVVASQITEEAALTNF